MMDADGWLRIDGETPRERLRDGFPQLLVVLVVAWLGTLVAYDLLSPVLGPVGATAVVALGGVLVALDLRDRMVGAQDGDDQASVDRAGGARE